MNKNLLANRLDYAQSIGDWDIVLSIVKEIREEMETYKWIMTFVIQGDQGTLNEGEVVTVEKKDGSTKQVMITHVYSYITKSGKTLDRALVEEWGNGN